MQGIRAAKPGEPFTVQEVYGSQMLPERIIIKPQCAALVTHWFCVDHRVLLHGFDILDHLRTGEHLMARWCPEHGHESLHEAELPDPAKEQQREQIARMSWDELAAALREARNL
jgi:hypothetical protein